MKTLRIGNGIWWPTPLTPAGDTAQYIITEIGLLDFVLEDNSTFIIAETE